MTRKLEELGHEELLTTVRSLLAETNALSSRIAAINEIGVAINRTFDLDEMLLILARQTKWLLDFEHCSICLPAVETQETDWRLVTVFGPPAQIEPAALITTPNLGSVLKTGQPRLIGEGCPGILLRGFLSQIILPLTSENQVIGAVIFASHARQRYRQDDLRIGYLLALQLSSALQNARQFDELKRARAELEHYTRDLEARNQELDAYNHTIAHDLKSPITGVIIKTQLIERQNPDLSPRTREHLEDIRASMFTMTDMIEQLLWLTRLRNGEDMAVSVDALAAIQAALSRFQHLIEEHHIQVEIGSNLPSAVGYPQWVEGIFANLISNAIKYMGDHNPDPRIIIAGNRQGDEVRYEVRDTGIGIAREDQSHLFEMFTRLHQVPAEGLGLGLSIVHRMVTQMQGRISVESEPGQGSCFWFTLPARENESGGPQTPA